jgi:DNA replication protein DnaD
MFDDCIQNSIKNVRIFRCHWHRLSTQMRQESFPIQETSIWRDSSIYVTTIMYTNHQFIKLIAYQKIHLTMHYNVSNAGTLCKSKTKQIPVEREREREREKCVNLKMNELVFVVLHCNGRLSRAESNNNIAVRRRNKRESQNISICRIITCCFRNLRTNA